MTDKFFADENVPKDLILYLRRKGYDIKSVCEERLFGLQDDSILELAKQEGRIAVSYDKDFLLLRQPPEHSGVIIIRYSWRIPSYVAEKFAEDFRKIKRFLKNSLFIFYDEGIEAR